MDNGNPEWRRSNTPITDSSNLVHFTVDVPPTISNLSIPNKTYTYSQIPLSFNVDSAIIQMSCTLDNKSRIIPGNTTIPVPEGSHSIAVYAEDTTGNVGNSGIVFFTVSIPTPSPSPSPIPSPSPTKQPTLEPIQTPIPIIDNIQTMDLTPILILSGTVAIGIAVCVLVYSKKKKRYLLIGRLCIPTMPREVSRF